MRTDKGKPNIFAQETNIMLTKSGLWETAEIVVWVQNETPHFYCDQSEPDFRAEMSETGGRIHSNTLWETRENGLERGGLQNTESHWHWSLEVWNVNNHKRLDKFKRHTNNVFVTSVAPLSTCQVQASCYPDWS